MAGVPWIRISTSMFEDEKVKLIQALPEGDSLVVIWLRLLTLAGKTNDRGYVYLNEGTPYTPQMLSVIMNKPQTVVDLALRTFSDFQMIEVNEQGICILNWEKHQNIDGLEKIRKQNRDRKRKQRARQKELPAPEPHPDSGSDESRDMSRDIPEEVTPSHATDKEEDKDIDKEKEREREKRGGSGGRENLCSKEDIKTFVESLSASNPLPVSQDLLVKYINCLRLTRKTARISQSIILSHWERWQQFPPVVVQYAMYIHLTKHDDKKEEYTLGIMRNTDEHEANRKMSLLKNKNQSNKEVPQHEQPRTSPSGSSSSDEPTDRYEEFIIE
ncbi:phage replisome organizer N-terminal domain-containing protein [Kroppenstedtia eburnea]|uniref:phage replisome organizer N-terminal domain-containing protein n=1 Tax=Kroppenstedtia eburnea TaxID=714067 RepID=UPI00362E23C4